MLNTSTTLETKALLVTKLKIAKQNNILGYLTLKHFCVLPKRNFSASLHFTSFSKVNSVFTFLLEAIILRASLYQRMWYADTVFFAFSKSLCQL